MNIIVVTPSHIEVYKSWSQMKKNTTFDKNDFTEHGGDYILNATEDTFTISKDIKLLENVAAAKMFTKNRMEFSDLIQIATLILVFVLMVK